MKKSDLIVVVSTLFVTGTLLKSINFFSFPSGDFFSYLHEGNAYLSGSLPSQLNHAPIYSVLVVLLGRLVPLQYPELVAGIILNVTLFAIGMWLYWKIAAKWYGDAGLLAVLWLLLHPLSYDVTLNSSNIVVFSTAVLATIYFRIKGKYALAYAIAGISYWIRPEAVALLAAMGLIDVMRKNQKKKILTYLILASIPFVLWEATVAFHNDIGNMYVAETLALKNEIPNRYFFNFTFSNLIISKQFLENPWLFGIILSYLTAGIACFTLVEDREKQLVALYALAYFATHLLFPGKGDSYTFPLLMPVALISYWPMELARRFNKKDQKGERIVLRLVFVLLSIGIIVKNITQIQPFLSEKKEYRGEWRMIANWITQQSFQIPTAIITFYWNGVEYFTENDSVEFFRVAEYIDRCDTITCIIFNNWNYFQNKDILLIQDSFTQKSDTIYDIQSGVKLFQNMENNQDKQNFRLTQMLESQGRWIRVYKFNIYSPYQDFDG